MARVTLVSRNFPPLSGGMERLVHKLYGGLVKNHAVSLLGPKGCEDFVAAGSDVKSTAVSPTPIFLLLTLIKGISGRISKGAADIVMGGSGLVGPVVILLAKISAAKSILLLHGLDIIADSRIYQWVFVPFLKHADLVICNSKNTHACVDTGRENASSGSAAAITSSTRPASAAPRARIETQSKERHAGTTPKVLIRPRVGFKPIKLLNAAGTRPEPAVSVPSAKLTNPIATATAEPELEPPETNSSSKLLRTAPYGDRGAIQSSRELVEICLANE